VRTQLFGKCQRQLISPVLRWISCLLHILQVWILYDTQAVFSVMSGGGNEFFRKCWGRSIPQSSLSILRRPTSIPRYEWCQNSTFTFCKLETCTTLNLLSPLWGRWILNFSESAENNSYFLLYDDFLVSCNILEVLVLYDVQPLVSAYIAAYMRILISAVAPQVYALYNPRRVLSIMSDVRTQLFRKCQRQLIPPVLQ